MKIIIFIFLFLINSILFSNDKLFLSKDCNFIFKEVYDGDTIKGKIDCLEDWGDFSIRIYGIDTPEIRTKNQEEKANGLKAKEFLIQWLKNNPNFSYKILGWDKYGRLLVDLIEYRVDIIKAGLANPYFGGKK